MAFSIHHKLQNIGPGILVAAAFIGPGTVTACTVAGADFGYALLWALAFATLATMVLQEMSARLGTISQQDLGEVLASEFASSFWKWPVFVLVGTAVFIGNAAYEGGNLTGAALGAQALFGDTPSVFNLAVVALAGIAIAILYRGNYQQIEKILVLLVSLMGIAFILTFFVVQPSLLSMIKGMLVPALPDGSLLTVMALIGTTVVPYNLFLHASAAKKKWQGEVQLKAAQTDTLISIGLGGLVAMFIVSTSAASIFAAGLSVQSASDMAFQLEPLAGSYSKWLIGFGLLAAGLSSAITAPLATGFALAGLMRQSQREQQKLSRVLGLLVAIAGTLFSLTGIKPIKIILMAQFANGLLLPLIACFLLYVMNKRAILGKHTNSLLSNLLGGGVLILATLLGMRLVALSLGWL